jgi:hypothetical protein
MMMTDKARIYITKTRSGHSCSTIKYRGCTHYVGKKFPNALRARSEAEEVQGAFIARIDAMLAQRAA